MKTYKHIPRLCLTAAHVMLLTTVCLVPAAHCAFEELTLGARPSALAGAFVGLAEGPETVFFNPAGLALAPSFAATVYYSRPFGLKELDLGALSLSQPTRFGTVTAAARLFGRSPYREQTFYLSYAQLVARRVSLGATAKLLHLQIHRYGSASTLGVDVGMLIKLSPRVHWGVAAINVNRPHIGECREALPQVFTTGLSARPLSPVVLALDLHKDVRHPLQIRFGTSYNMMKRLIVRFGVHNNPSRFTLGFGIKLNPLRLDYALSTHYDLGLTHSVSISFFSR